MLPFPTSTEFIWLSSVAPLKSFAVTVVKKSPTCPSHRNEPRDHRGLSTRTTFLRGSCETIFGCGGQKKQGTPRWNPGKWKHGHSILRSNSWLNFDPYPAADPSASMPWSKRKLLETGPVATSGFRPRRPADCVFFLQLVSNRQLREGVNI